MKIAVLHGQMHKGSTYHLTHMVLDRFPDAELTEWFLPKDGPGFCVGCNRCFLEGEEHCPHAAAVAPVEKSLEEADLIVLESPCYVFGITAQLKAFLDHMGHRWMPHRPHPAMFRKVGLVVSTAAGGGTKEVVKALKRHLLFWGVPRTYQLTANVYAARWEEVPEDRRAKLQKQAARTAARAARSIGKSRPGIKTVFLFSIMRSMQKREITKCAYDHAYWERNGWMDGKRPWR